MSRNKSILRKKSFDFSIRIVRLYQYLKEKKELIIAIQILKSGTSIGANISEAQNAESLKDFIHKLALAQKETEETIYWLELLIATNLIDERSFHSIINQAWELMRMIRSAIITSKNKIGKSSE